MQFIPEQPKRPEAVPFFDDVTSEGGWQGHATRKSLDTLKSEITTCISRLGGMVTGFQRGTFQIGELARDGFRIHYTIDQPSGALIPCRLDVAALPVRYSHRTQRSYESRREKSLKMALYMLRQALDGLWFLQNLSPGYAPLMPWMLDSGSDKTLTQLWSETALMGRLLPPGGDFVEGEIVE